MSLKCPSGGIVSEVSPIYLIKKARDIYSQSELANILKVSERTIRRWEVNETAPPAYLAHAIRQMILPLPFNDNKTSDFKFIDLFAGIGGIRIGLNFQKKHTLQIFLRPPPIFSPVILQRLMSPIFLITMSFWPDFLANHSALPAFQKRILLADPMVLNVRPKEHFFSMLPEFLQKNALRHFYWKMSKILFHMTKAIHSG